MSINAINTDPQISAIRSIVSAKNSRVPFLLLPVRIETRFMKVTKPTIHKVDESLFGDILIDLSRVDQMLLEPIEKMSAPKVKAKLEEVTKLEKSFRSKAKKLSQVNKEQKTWLNQIQSDISTRVKKLAAQLPRTSAPIVTKLSNRLTNSIKALDDKAPTKSHYANTFVTELIQLEKGLKALDGKNTPYTKKENKKTLYRFVEDKIQSTKEFYEGGLNKITNIQNIEPNQLEKIEDAHQKIKKRLQNLEKRLRPLHKDNNWRAFVESRQHLVNLEFESLFSSFEKQVLQQLQQKSNQRVIDSNQYLFTSLNLQRTLTKFKHTEKVNHKNIKALRKAINNRVTKLETYQTKSLIGTESQQTQMENVWQKINTDLANIDKRLDRASVPTSNQTFSLNLSKTTLKSISNNKKINLNKNVSSVFNTPDAQKTWKFNSVKKQTFLKPIKKAFVVKRLQCNGQQAVIGLHHKRLRNNTV